jgi:hypothetical protein
LLSCLFYRKEVLAPYWSNAFATQILGYETPEHNILYAQQGEHTFRETMSYFVKQIFNRSFVHRAAAAAFSFRPHSIVWWRHPGDLGRRVPGQHDIAY